jgi:hypothetical protein
MNRIFNFSIRIREDLLYSWGPLSLVSTTEELLGRRISGSGLEKFENTAVWIYHTGPRGTLYPQNLAVTSPISADISVGIVRLQTQATESFTLRVSKSLNWIFRCLFFSLLLSSFGYCILREHYCKSFRFIIGLPRPSLASGSVLYCCYG